MRVVEEPFVTRDSILSVLRPGEITNSRRFRTLREHEAASRGVTVPMRLESGRMDGRIHLYSNLNTDAARAYRLGRVKVAQKLAQRASKLEGSAAAKKIQRAVTHLADRMPSNPCGAEASPNLRRYIQLRRHSSWRGLDRDVLVRDWLSGSRAWLEESANQRESLVDAIESLGRETAKARAQILDEESKSVSTFLGVVVRMDVAFAELESEYGEVVVIAREDLGRQGLAALGQPVSLLSEALPGGGTYHLPMNAALLEAPKIVEPDSPWSSSLAEEMAITVSDLEPRDSTWIERELSRDPEMIPVGPLRVA